MTTELAIIENLELVPFFTKGDSVDEILEKIAKEARAHVPDISTLKGRNAIKANVTKVTKSKTYLEEHRKKLADEYKAIPKVIDATGRKVKGFLNDVIEEIRHPLTEWETIDKAEKQQVIDTEAYLIKFAADLDDGYRDNELFDLKAAQAETERKAEIERAEIRATAKAEQQAAAEIAKANQDKIDAEQREELAKQAAKNAEWLNYIAEAYEINAKIESDKQAAIALRDAKDRAQVAEWVEYISEAYAINDKLIATENARLAEAKRQETLQENQRQQEAQRQADKKHCGNVNRLAMDAFIKAGLSQEQAKLAVIAIAKNLIPAVEIKY